MVMLSDNAYTDAISRSDGGTAIRTSQGARLLYQTAATKLYLEHYNDIYSTYPTFGDIGVRKGGADVDAVEPTADGTQHSVLDLPAGNGVVEIINSLQSNPAATRIGSFACRACFNALATLLNGATSPRLIMYGDSIMAGGNADDPSLEGVAQLVRNAYSGSLIIESFGYRTLYMDCPDAAGRTAFAAFLASLSPDTIWIGIGRNDWALERWSASDFGTAYADLLDKLNSNLPGAEIYCQSPLVNTSEVANTFGDTLGDYRTPISTAAAARDYCTYVEGETILTTGDLADGVHPSTAGHAVWAEAVKTALGLSS